MKIEFYGLRQAPRGTPDPKTGLTYASTPSAEPDLEHELPAPVAAVRAKCGDVVLVKVWLRTDGVAQLDDLEARLRAALSPMGLK